MPYWSATACCKPPIGSPAPNARSGKAVAAADETCAGETLISPAFVMACPGPARKDRAASSLRNRLRM